MLKAGLIAAPVFCSRTGKHLFKRNLLRAFWAAVKGANDLAAELPPEEAEVKRIPDGLRFHDLRHTSASILLSQASPSARSASASGTATPP
jgi:integrase